VYLRMHGVCMYVCVCVCVRCVCGVCICVRVVCVCMHVCICVRCVSVCGCMSVICSFAFVLRLFNLFESLVLTNMCCF